MDSAAEKTLEEMGRGLGVDAAELGRIRREERIQRRRLAIISFVAGVGSFILGAVVSETISPIEHATYPYAAALPLLGISRVNRRSNILRIALVSGLAFVLGVLFIHWQPQHLHNGPYYGVFAR